MSEVYPQQFVGWLAGQQVIWVYPEDLDVAYHYNNCQRIQLKLNAVRRAVFDANEIINRIFYNG